MSSFHDKVDMRNGSLLKRKPINQRREREKEREPRFILECDEAVNPTSESHDFIAQMNYLRKRKKEKT